MPVNPKYSTVAGLPVCASGRLAELSEVTVEALNAVLPRTWSHASPVDTTGDAPGSRYADALRILLEAPEVDAVLVLNCPTAIASGAEAAHAAGGVAAEVAELLANGHAHGLKCLAPCAALAPGSPNPDAGAASE